MTRQQYVEINGTKHYLNDEGDLTNGVGNVLIRGWAIATLGLKVETEEYVIVWSGGLAFTKPQTLPEAQAELKRAWDTGEIFRLVPLDVAGEEQ